MAIVVVALLGCSSSSHRANGDGAADGNVADARVARTWPVPPDAVSGCHTPKVIIGGPDCPVGAGCVIATCHGLDYSCTCNPDGTLVDCKLSDD